MKIVTKHVLPPIPEPGFDWCAYYEDDVEQSHLYGWGATEQEALDDLKRLNEEMADDAEEEAARADEDNYGSF